MIECSTTPNGLHPPPSASGGPSDSYFTPHDTTSSEPLTTPYFTAPRSPLLQHQEFFNAIQTRYSTPFAETRKAVAPTPRFTPSGTTLIPFTTAQVHELLQDQQHLLLIDTRSFVHYSHLHVKGAINVSIPNTILKRPSFTLEKVLEVIVAESHRQAWAGWPHATHIILYDQASDLPEPNTAIAYLAAKFRLADFQGKLGYLKGGLNAFHHTYPSRCTTTSSSSSSSPLSPSASAATHAPPLATAAATRQKKPVMHLGALPPAPITPGLMAGPFTAPMASHNPFFTNIRQNMELSHGSIKERFPVRPPPQYHAGDAQIPDWLHHTLTADGPRRLAEMYESIERAEQKRLQSVMAHHSNTTACQDHPLSIVAGIEMGALNRYTNIWPFEYTRVKLQGSRYMNASYIEYTDCDPAVVGEEIPNLRTLDEQRRLSKRLYRRYISTQGPLPATFADFWNMVWEQNTRVIVMLTKEEEMNRIKCHRYWPTAGSPMQFGPLQVSLQSERVENLSGRDEDQMVIRAFVCQHENGQQRVVHHLQYHGWMDFGVPDDPKGTLKLIHQANALQPAEAGPMIVHCSAGCGRAGAFCTIDTVLFRLQNNPYHHDVLYQTVAKFREQRVSMVQTLRQFVFCYEAVLWWMCFNQDIYHRG